MNDKIIISHAVIIIKVTHKEALTKENNSSVGANYDQSLETKVST